MTPPRGVPGSRAAGSRRAPGGGWTKSGKPRPGTGGRGKRKLEGKGPTPPAELRPGHPAQRRATGKAKRTDAGAGGAARNATPSAVRPGADRYAGRAGTGRGSMSLAEEITVDLAMELAYGPHRPA